MLVYATSFTLTINIFMDTLEGLNLLKTHKSCIMTISESRKRLLRNLKLLSRLDK